MKEIRQIMEYVQLEGIHIHEDGYAKFIELTLNIGFSPKASGFYPFDDATALTGEGGVGDVVWLIQASA